MRSTPSLLCARFTRRSSKPEPKIPSKSAKGAVAFPGRRLASRFWVVVLASSALLAAGPSGSPAECIGPTTDGNAPNEAVVCSGDRRSPAPEGAIGRLFGVPLDANRADSESLETLPSIGPARASAWILERSRTPLRTWQDLERIPGIGPKRAAALRDELCFVDCAACGEGHSC